MISHWVDQAKQDEDCLGLEGLRRIQPYGWLHQVEPATFSLPLGHQSQQTGVGPAPNEINVYVHPYPIGRSSRKPARSPPQMPSLSHNITRLPPPQISPPEDTDTYSLFGDGCTSKPNRHPSCTGDSRDGSTMYGDGDWRDSRPMSGENGRRNSWYNSRAATFNSGSLPQYQEGATVSLPQYQEGTNLNAASASSGFGNGFQPFSTGRSEDGDRTRSQCLGGGMRPTLIGQPGVSRYNGGRRYSGPRSTNGHGKKFCNFCKTNGESSSVYLNHNIGAPGAVTCPNLFKHACEICGASGRNAHTRGYCPQRDTNECVVLAVKGTQRKSDGSFR